LILVILCHAKFHRERFFSCNDILQTRLFFVWTRDASRLAIARATIINEIVLIRSLRP
jgi:hypothetical protein